MKNIIGKKFRFKYGDYGTPDNYPDYTAHRNQWVEVIRQLTDEEVDPECQPMFEIKANDGWVGHANLDELVGETD